MNLCCQGILLFPLAVWLSPGIWNSLVKSSLVSSSENLRVSVDQLMLGTSKYGPARGFLWVLIPVQTLLHQLQSHQLLAHVHHALSDRQFFVVGWSGFFYFLVMALIQRSSLSVVPLSPSNPSITPLRAAQSPLHTTFRLLGVHTAAQDLTKFILHSAAVNNTNDKQQPPKFLTYQWLVALPMQWHNGVLSFLRFFVSLFLFVCLF